MPYNKGATKAMNAIKKEYGSDWAHVYYGLANKRAGKGLRGKHRGHVAANAAYAKGSHWGGKRKSAKRRKSSRVSSGGSRITVRARGKANITRRTRHARVHVRVG